MLAIIILMRETLGKFYRQELAMKTMSIEKMRAALSERRLDHVVNATGVKKRTIQAIISGQSTNPTYNVFV